MSEFTEINEAWWDWYYKDNRNKTGKERKQFAKEKDEGKQPFIYKDKQWGRESNIYYSNSGKTKDRSIYFRANDGTIIDIESSYKRNRKNSAV